jgi:hypothetical protein
MECIIDVIFVAAILYIFNTDMNFDVLMLYIPLYWCLAEDGALLLKHVGGFMFMDNL